MLTDLFTGKVFGKVQLLWGLLLLQFPLRDFDVVKSVAGKAAQHFVGILHSQQHGMFNKYVNCFIELIEFRFNFPQYTK